MDGRTTDERPGISGLTPMELAAWFANRGEHHDNTGNPRAGLGALHWQAKAKVHLMWLRVRL